MANPQLLEFIREQIKLGTPAEEIKKSLSSSGWQTNDIDEGFFAVNNAGATPPPPTSPFIEQKIKIPGYPGPEQSTTAGGPTPLTTRGVDIPGPKASQNIPTGGRSIKKIVILLVTLIIIGLIGAGLYFFVYPLLTKTPTTSPTPTPATSITPLESPILATPTPIISATPTPTTMTAVHTSLINADKIEEVESLTSANLESIRAGKSLLKEIIIKPITPPTALSNFLPSLIDFSAQELKSNFNEDFTVFIYYDDIGGEWPGIVLKRKQEADAISAQNIIKRIEIMGSLNGLFLINPGTPQGDFKSGNYKGINTRYLTYSAKGAAINYAWKGDILMLTTTFPALQALIDGKLVESTPAKKIVACDDTTCFNPEFKACNIGSIYTEQSSSDVATYTIIGPDAGKCRVEVKVIKSSKPGFTGEGKSMTCLLNNAKSYIEAAEIFSSTVNIKDAPCTGALFDIIKAQNK